MTLREEIEKMYDSKHYGAPRYDEIETLVNDQITSFAEEVEKQFHVGMDIGQGTPKEVLTLSIKFALEARKKP